MDPERRERVKDLFEEALQHEPSRRAAFLAEACAGDDTLRREVAALLSAHEAAGSFLATPVPPRNPSAPRVRLSDGARLGPYEIRGLLGTGGMGEVYRAYDRNLGRDVAIKTLPSALAASGEALARFRREARVLASLNHPNIAAIYDVKESDGVHFLVLELVPGETLADRIGGGDLDIQEALRVCHQIAEALEAAHEKGVIHRDLKPANVKITPQGRVKVLDFGLATAPPPEPGAADSQMTTAAAEITKDGMILGTAAYMSPEQARGKAVDKRTDVWSFGCLLYEALTRQRPFRGETATDFIAAILTQEPDWDRLPPAIPPGVRKLVRRCLEKDPQQRLRDIGDARLELEEALAPPARPAEAARGRTKRWLSGAAAAVALALAVVLAWRAAWLSRSRPVQTREIRQRQITGNPTDDPVFVAAISPDGKYLAYTDLGGLHLRLIETGETRVLPVPEQFCFR
jgi:hypothetical protein